MILDGFSNPRDHSCESESHTVSRIVAQSYSPLHEIPLYKEFRAQSNEFLDHIKEEEPFSERGVNGELFD